MDAVKSIKLSGHVIRRIIIALFCIFVAADVVYVMFNVYTPNKNALGALGSVSMDIICIIILLILICSIAFDRYDSNRTTKLFAILLVATTWAIFLDFLNWAFDGSLEFGHLTFLFTLGSLCMGSILAGLFCLYLYSYMDATYSLSRMRLSARICALLNLCSFCLTFILAISGTAFEFVDGHYEVGALYDVVTVIPILSILYMCGFVIRYVKKIGFHDVFAVVGYMLFMIAGALIESSFRIGTTYVSVSIADIFIFVMLQNQIIAREKRNVQVWMKKSNTDELTGFLNRHAYEDDIERLEKSVLTDDFVYVSADVNSLKSVNDSYGHYAGDEMLIGAAECLKKCFSQYGKLYRVGGDEFIALINADEAHISDMKQEIEDLTEKWSGNLVPDLTISFGYVTKKEAGNMSIREMAVLADKRMYEAKNEYYRRTGIDRRKN